MLPRRQRSRARETARSTARSVHTPASCVLYAADPVSSGRSSSPSAARADAAFTVEASAAFPCSACSTFAARVTFGARPVIATRAHCTALRESSETSAATPTMANREAGFGSFSYAPAVRAGGSGTRTCVRSSPGSSAVLRGPTISSSTFIVRSPRGPATTTEASRATSTAGQSAEGSACARLPPMVPRFRTCASPICPAASAAIGSFARISSDEARAACVVSAPIKSAPCASRTPVRPSTFRRSTRCAGCARRSFINGTRLWLPASTFASSPYWPRGARASETVAGAWYSKGAQYMGSSSVAPQGLPDASRSERHVDVADAERRDRVHHRVGDGGGGGDGPGLAGALCPERGHPGRRLRPPHLDRGQVVCVRHRVVHERPGDQLPVLVVFRVLPERLRDALGDAAVHHPVHDHRVDHAAQIVHGEVTKHLHLPGVADHLHHADVRPEGEDEVARIEEADRLQARLEVLRHAVREVRHERDVAERLEARR